MSAIVSNEVYLGLTRWFLIPANITASILGVFSNALNLIVFLNMTNKDTMTISFIGLSLSDFLFACFNLMASIASCLIFNGIPMLYKVDLESLIIVGFVWQRPLFHKISALITTFASFERALCVVRPFLVKTMFNKKRNILIIISCYLIFIAAFMPVYPSGKLTWQSTNKSSELILRAYFTHSRYEIENALALSVGLTFIWISQTLIMTNAIVMAVGLRQSRKFRQSLGTIDTPQVKAGTKEPAKKTDSTSAAKADAPVDKGAKLIKTVLTLAVMHVSLNAPLSVHYICFFVIPELKAYRLYHNLYMIAIDSVNLLETLNGVFNTVVYLTLNSKYRSTLMQVFCRCRKKELDSKT